MSKDPSQNEIPQRQFTGIWIPSEIWLEEDLTSLEKMLWAEIHSLSKRAEGCTASNSHFVEFFGVTERWLQKSLANLKSKGLVKEESFNGRKRALRAYYPESCSNPVHRRGVLKDTPAPSFKTPPPSPPNKDEITLEIEGGGLEANRELDASRNLCSFFFSELKRHKPNAIATEHSKTAQDAAKRLLRVRTGDEVRSTILEAFKDVFWANILTSLGKLLEHLDAIENTIKRPPKASSVLKKNREILRSIKEKYPNQEIYGVRYGPDSVIFIGGAVDMICKCDEMDFCEKIEVPLKNRKMEVDNV